MTFQVMTGSVYNSKPVRRTIQFGVALTLLDLSLLGIFCFSILTGNKFLGLIVGSLYMCSRVIEALRSPQKNPKASRKGHRRAL